MAIKFGIAKMIDGDEFVATSIDQFGVAWSGNPDNAVAFSREVVDAGLLTLPAIDEAYKVTFF